MSTTTYEFKLGKKTVKIVERDLSGSESTFYVGKKETVVDLKYNGRKGVSFYHCEKHGRKFCPHVRMVMDAVNHRLNAKDEKKAMAYRARLLGQLHPALRKKINKTGLFGDQL